jgi:hypothetical protein
MHPENYLAIRILRQGQTRNTDRLDFSSGNISPRMAQFADIANATDRSTVLFIMSNSNAYKDPELGRSKTEKFR